MTFGGQISDEVGHLSPFALTLDSAASGVEQSWQFSWEPPVGAIYRAGRPNGIKGSRRSSRYLFPKITAVCSVPNGFAEARSLSQASAAIRPWRWRNAQLGTSRFCLTQAKTQARKHAASSKIHLLLWNWRFHIGLQKWKWVKAVHQVNNPSRPAACTVPLMSVSAENTFIQLQLLRGISTTSLWSAVLLLFIDWLERSSSRPCQVAEQLMTIAYESGVNLFDTAEVYSGGKWVMIPRPVCYRRRHATLREVGPSVQGQAVTLHAICIILFMTGGSLGCSQLCRPNHCLWNGRQASAVRAGIFIQWLPVKLRLAERETLKLWLLLIVFWGCRCVTDSHAYVLSLRYNHITSLFFFFKLFVLYRAEIILGNIIKKKCWR